nr:hypothetical protein [Candidatus Sigynarchaeota archaeon]
MPDIGRAMSRFNKSNRSCDTWRSRCSGLKANALPDARAEVGPEPGLDGGRPRGDAGGLVEVDLGIGGDEVPEAVDGVVRPREPGVGYIMFEARRVMMGIFKKEW